jgi:hypothetical protein
MPAARATWAARQAARRSSSGGALMSAAAVAPAVGDAVTFNAARDPSCGPSGDFRAGHVKAISQYAIVVADDQNPAGGFSDADYTQIAQAFADSVYPLDTRNFGAPTDIDTNGHVIIFYTSAVNALTPPNSDFYIGGFFHPRDLFPKTSTDPNFACGTSNEAEMFYMLVPDPNGTVNGNPRSLDFVRSQTVGILAHEFQHLINAARRLYINNADDFEEVWLNEGLSHIAEELMFYEASGLAPRQNITLTKLRSSQRILDAVNAYQVANLGRLIDYVQNPETNSPYAANDSLATRGATWQLLRYAADHSTKTEEAVWQGLVNARISGIPNMTAQFGDFMALARNWAASNYTDDVVQTTAVFQQPSWHFRSVLPVLINRTTPPPYPLKTRALTSAAPVPVTLTAGGAAYLRFGVAGGATGSVHVTSGGAAPPSTVALTLVRTK